MLNNPHADLDSSRLIMDSRRVTTGVCLLGIALLVLLPGLTQGLNWDEFWLVAQGRALLARGDTDAYKPLAGALAVPFLGMESPWVGLRLGWLVFQGLLAVILWRMMPGRWSSQWRVLFIGLLWLEPTFRERVLEVRTDAPVLILLAFASMTWFESPSRPVRTGLAIGLAMALTPRSLMWVLPWFLGAWLLDAGPGKARRLGWTAGVAICFAGALWWMVASWTHRSVADLLRDGARIGALAAHSGRSLFSPNSLYYLWQTLRMGLPFYALAGWGLTRLVFPKDRSAWGEAPAWAHLSIMGVAVFAMTPFYDGAFPYHFIGVIPCLLPLVATGLEDLMARAGRPAAFGAAALALGFAFIAAAPLLKGPSLKDQMSFLAYMRNYLHPGLGYVDGIGGLKQPQSAPFVTAKVAAFPENQDLGTRWDRERVSLFVLNGRSEQLFSPANITWVKPRMVQIHPNLLVLGTGVEVHGRRSYEGAWTVPWNAPFQFFGTPSWRWTVNGKIVQQGTRLELPEGKVVIQGQGEGNAAFGLVLAADGHQPPARPLYPFFMPFQREGW